MSTKRIRFTARVRRGLVAILEESEVLDQAAPDPDTALAAAWIRQETTAEADEPTVRKIIAPNWFTRAFMG